MDSPARRRQWPRCPGAGCGTAGVRSWSASRRGAPPVRVPPPATRRVPPRHVRSERPQPGDEPRELPQTVGRRTGVGENLVHHLVRPLWCEAEHESGRVDQGRPAPFGRGEVGVGERAGQAVAGRSRPNGGRDLVGPRGELLLPPVREPGQLGGPPRFRLDLGIVRRLGPGVVRPVGPRVVWRDDRAPVGGRLRRSGLRRSDADRSDVERVSYVRRGRALGRIRVVGVWPGRPRRAGRRRSPY